MITWDPKDYATHSAGQQEWAHELLSKLHMRGDERVLDIGCGDGKVTVEIAERLPRGEVVGVDSSTGMVAYAREAFPSTRNRNLSFVVGDASALSFASEFDIVFSNACLHWIHDHRPVLEGIRRALRPGGRMLLQMGGAGNAAEVLGVVNVIMTEQPWREYLPDLSFRYGFYGPEEYRAWLAEARLRPIRVELIPKRMLHTGAAGLASWIRTTWLGFTQAVPESTREQFIATIVDRYLRSHPLTAEGMAAVQMQRLEVEAELA